MTAYFVSYDLNSPGQSYARVDKAMREIGAARVLETVWLVATSLTAGAIRDKLKAVVDSNDKVLVMQVGPAWGSLNLPQDWVNWLNANVG